MRAHLLLIAFVLTSLPVSAAQKVPGTIFYPDHKEEVQVFVRELTHGDPDFIKLQSRIRYLGADGVKKYVYPNEVNEVRIWFDGKTYRMKSIPSGHGNKMFAYLVIDGRMSLYLYQYISDYNSATHSGGHRHTVYFMRHQDGRNPSFNYWGLPKEDVEKWVADCPKVVEMIENKKLRIWNQKLYEEVVNLYNANCGQ